MLVRAIALGAVILLLGAPAGARQARAEELPTHDVQTPDDGGRGDDVLCMSGNTAYYWTVGEWFSGNESYKVYCEPTDCQECDGGWKPFSVTMYLYWEQENSCALTVSSAIERIGEGDPECPTPGTLICESAPVTLGPFSPAGLWAITIPLPEHCPTLEEPFFATIRFHDTCDDLPILVTDPGPCDDCHSWNDWGAGWRQLCEHGFPGNLTAYATIKCAGPTPVEGASWGSIKAMYK